MVRMTYAVETREYVEKQRAEDRTDKGIHPCIKRYLARHVGNSVERGLTDIQESVSHTSSTPQLSGHWLLSRTTSALNCLCKAVLIHARPAAPRCPRSSLKPCDGSPDGTLSASAEIPSTRPLQKLKPPHLFAQRN